MGGKPQAYPRLRRRPDNIATILCQFFADFGKAMAKGDLFVKLTLIWWGAGCLRRKQYAKALILTLLEAGVIWFTCGFAMAYVPKFATLGTVQAQQVFNMQTMQSEWNDYDNSFMILLFSLFSFVVWAAALVLCMKSVIGGYRLLFDSQNGLHIISFREDLQYYLDQ